MGWIFFLVAASYGLLLLVEMNTDANRHEARAWIRRELRANWLGLSIAALGLVILLAGFLYEPSPQRPSWLNKLVTDLYANGGVELVAIAITVLIIDRFNRIRLRQEEKKRLMLQMGSPSPGGFAIEAARQLRVRGWLTDGSLVSADLTGANLVGADLRGANLAEVMFSRQSVRVMAGYGVGAETPQVATLEKANLEDANLTRSGLFKVTLRSAILDNTNLEGADLTFAVLENTRLFGTNLTRTQLKGADFTGAELVAANFTGSDVTPEQLEQATTCKGVIFSDGTLFQPSKDLADDQ